MNATNASNSAAQSIASHTPGPWTTYLERGFDGDWTLIMAGGAAGRIVANVNSQSCPDSTSAPAHVVMPMEANARLIAAAPELLEALNAAAAEMADTLDHLSRLNPAENSAYVRDLRNALDYARAAIAKAEGKQ